MGSVGTAAYGISGGNIVGIYGGLGNAGAGFFATPDGLDQWRYTLYLSSTDTNPAVPNSPGYSTLMVGSSGAATMAGKLPDGESFRVSGVVKRLGGSRFSFSQPLSYPSVTPKGAKGLLAGSLWFTAVPGVSDLSGTLTWSKPEQTKGTYPAVIDTTLNAAGSSYVYTREDGALPGFPILGGTASGSLELSDTNGFDIAVPVQIEAGKQLILTNPPDNLKISITASTGVLKGSFVYPGQTKATDISGVLFQDQVNGGGFFLGPNGSGTVGLTPAP